MLIALALLQSSGEPGFLGKVTPFVVAVIIVASIWKIFTKAGQPGWASIIPIYNAIVLLKIVGKPWWWLILFFIPIVNLIVTIYVVHLLSVSFGRGIGTTLGLLFLGFMFYPLLGFGDAQYRGAPA